MSTCGYFCDYLRLKLFYCCCPCYRPPSIDVWKEKGTDFSPLAKEGGTFSVLTYNTQQLLHKSDEETAAKIAQFCTKYDIVCLQEVFDEKSRSVMRDTFIKAGFQCGISRGGHEAHCGLGEDSGLFVASKGRITDAEFYEYDDFARTSSDLLSHKGFLLFKVDVGAAAPLAVCNTHCQAWPKHKGIRAKQLAQMKAKAKSYAKESPLLLVGDLNVADVNNMYEEKKVGADPQEYVDEFKRIQAIFPDAVDIFNTHNPGHNLVTIDSQRNTRVGITDPGKHESERVDHQILLRQKFQESGVLSSVSAVIEEADGLSDHYGVAAVYNLQ